MGGFLGEGNGDFTNTVEMLRDAVEEFPNEPELLIKLAECLFFLGWQKNGVIPTTKEGSPYRYDDVERNKEYIYWQESLQVYDKLLHLNVATKYREAAYYNMLHIYKHIGEYEKAKALANEQPHLHSCKEVLLTLVHLIEAVFPDGRCGRMHWDLRYLYLVLSMQESCHGDREKALTYFEKGFDHHKVKRPSALYAPKVFLLSTAPSTMSPPRLTSIR